MQINQLFPTMNNNTHLRIQSVTIPVMIFSNIQIDFHSFRIRFQKGR